MEYPTIPVDDLIPYINNSRTHSEEQINQVASSIKEFGFLSPVVIDKDNGLLAGHCRTQAAKKLGIERVPYVMADHLSEAQKKAFIISDNKLALNSGWDLDLLKIEIEELKDIDFDIDILGFEDVELKHILDGWESDLEIIDGDNDSEQENSFTLKVTGYKDDEDLIKRDIDTILTKYNGAKCE